MNWCLAMLGCLGIVAGNILPVRKDDTIQKNQTPESICETVECLRSAIDLVSAMDTTADPCEDFYQYACGNWGEEHPRPPDMPIETIFNLIKYTQNQVDISVQDFLTKNSSDHPRAVQQAKDMYKACLNSKDELDESGFKTIFDVLETLGLPLLPTYNDNNRDFDDSDFASYAYSFDWLETIIKAKTYLAKDLLIGFDVMPDPLNTTRFIIDLGSPSATKLLNHGSNTIANIFQREESKTKTSTPEDDDDDVVQLFVTELFKSFGLNKTDFKDKIKQMKNVYKTIKDDIEEIQNNNSHSDSDDNDSFEKYYLTVAELQELTDKSLKQYKANPHPLIWKRYLEEIFNMNDVSIDVENMKILVYSWDLKYLTQMSAYISETPPAAMELFIWIKVLSAIMETKKKFTSSDCAGIVTKKMSMAVSYGVIDPRVFEIQKPKSEIMLNELKNALKHSISQAEWMDDITKQSSYKKIADMKTFIGYPDWLFIEGKLDEYYKGLEIQTDSHLKNVISVNQMQIQKMLNKIHSANNESWRNDHITPISVNAEYMLQENAINVPVVMLQYPFGDLGLFSLNYGKIGLVLGHEITHGFDNQGRQYDKNGNKLQWWSNESISSFEKKTQCFVDQYSDYYIPEIGKHVNGNNTLGENIADNGGIHIALQALKTHLGETGPEAKLPGFQEYTSEQMFFLSVANVWCEVSTKESLTSSILYNNHSPSRFRVLGPLQNSPDFSRAYKCKSGSKMNPEKKCILY